MDIKLREVTNEDLLLIFDWANEPFTRAMSFNEEPIPLENHKKWFNNVLNSDDIYLLVVEEENNNIPIGQVRFDNKGVISISISKEFRGNKIAPKMILKGIQLIENKDYFLI